MQISSDGSTLTLSGVTRHHAGVYKCAASNGVGRDAVEEIHLQVLCEYYRPQLTTDQYHLVVVVEEEEEQEEEQEEEEEEEEEEINCLVVEK